MPDLQSRFPPRPTRVHEMCGTGAACFAAICAARLPVAGTPLFWVRESWRNETLNPLGLGDFIDPSQLLLAQAGNQAEALAVAEEALRDGALPLVVIELSQPLNLTAGRRLQLAAQAGKATGLCLIPEGAGSNAAETRWRCTPAFDPETETRADDGRSTLHRWDLIKNKSGTIGAWHVRWDSAARRLHDIIPVAP